MKTFRLKFIALAVTIGLLGVFGNFAQSAHAELYQSCGVVNEFSSRFLTFGGMWPNNWKTSYESRTRAFADVSTMSCTMPHEGQAFVFQSKNPGIKYPLVLSMKRLDWAEKEQRNYTFRYEVDFSSFPVGIYRFGWQDFKDEEGNSSGSRVATYWEGSSARYYEFDWRGVTPPTSTSIPRNTTTTTSPPVKNFPEVLSDTINLIVTRANFAASVYYTAEVRCSSLCGTLPDYINAQLCEVNSKYGSPSCLARSTMFPHGTKKRNTKLGYVNTYYGTFAFEKRPTGKTYKVYLSIPAGRNRKPVEGISTIKWNTTTLKTPMPTVVQVPTTTVTPGASTTVTTIAGTSPTTTSNVVSSAALSVVSDSVSGKSALTVKGNGAAITIDATINCSGACTKLPTSISGRMCKVGTSYSDASCTSNISLYPTAGSSSTNATFHGNTMFGTSPTGAVYQPYFNMVASGISGRTTLTGTSRVTWTK